MKRLTGILTLIILATSSFAQKQNINLVFIGNSITYGALLSDAATEAPPVIASAYLQQQKGIGAVAYSNQGHGGYTTLDFLPGGDAFAKVEQAANAFADKDALLIFSIKLGTNDSAIKGTHGAPVSVDDYRANLKTIVDRLLTDFPKALIIFQHPTWYSPNTYNGAMYLQEGLTRLQSYMPEIDALVKEYKPTQPNRMFVGDTKAFNYFKKNYLTDLNAENGKQGIFYLHPNKKGAAALGQYWGQAIMHCIKKGGYN